MISTLGLSLLFGFGPPLVWLTLWLQEDTNHPEPRSAIIKTFTLGGVAVFIAAVTEKLIEPLLQDQIFYLFLSWSIIEEGLKLLAVLLALHYFRAPIDEPIDWLIYMITAALGFAAVENTLFLLEPFSSSYMLDGFVLSNLRFMGATVLHLVASAAHGAALGLCFYLSNEIKYRYYVIGFSTAVIVHVLFNYLLVIGNNSATALIAVFGGVWLLILPLILIFEKIKTIKNSRNLIQ
tara:strand:- start:416 stop:1123 length:708 start_codon:yes stop_codon:yes gene_type:complete